MLGQRDLPKVWRGGGVGSPNTNNRKLSCSSQYLVTNQNQERSRRSEIAAKLDGIVKIVQEMSHPSAPLSVAEALISVAGTLNAELTEWQEKAFLMQSMIDELTLQRDGLAKVCADTGIIGASDEQVMDSERLTWLISQGPASDKGIGAAFWQDQASDHIDQIVVRATIDGVRTKEQT